jgi:ankyrin repeat protein
MENKLPEFKIALKENPQLINHQDGIGCTLLMYAAMEGRADFITYLLENTANPNLIDMGHNTALHYVSAKHKDSSENKKLLEDIASYVNPPAFVTNMIKNLTDELEKAPTEETYQTSCELLVAHAATAFSKNLQGQTPLHLAESNNHEAIAKMLIDKFGYENLVGIKDNYKKSALDYAKQSNRGWLISLAPDTTQSITQKDNSPVNKSPTSAAAQAASKSLAADLRAQYATPSESISDFKKST